MPLTSEMLNFGMSVCIKVAPQAHTCKHRERERERESERASERARERERERGGRSIEREESDIRKIDRGRENTI